MFFRILERVQDSVDAHPPEQAHAAVAAERADLDRLEGANGARDDFQMEAVESAHGDGRQPLADAALANLAQHFVLGAEDFLGPARERGVALAESLVLRRVRVRHGADSTPPPPRRLAAITRHIRGATPSCGPRASSFRAAALSPHAKASSDAAVVGATRAAPASRAAARARCGGSASSIFRPSLRPSPPKEDGPAEWPSRSCCGAALRDRSRDGPGRRTARAARRPATGASRPPPRTPPRPSGPWPPPRSGARAAGRGR